MHSARTATLATAFLAAVATVAVVRDVPPAASELVRPPGPIRGVALGSDTGLRLLVADNPPFVLDVDRATTTRVTGVSKAAFVVLWVVAVGGREAVAVADSAPAARLYGIRGASARVARLGTGTQAWADAGGRAAWILSRVGRSRCRMRLSALDGRLLRRPQPFPCPTFNDPSAGSLGLVVNGRQIVSPRTGRTVLRTDAPVVAAVGRKLVLRQGPRALALLDAASGITRRLGWPSSLSRLDQPAADPRGRYIALAFADPAWHGGGRQVMDIWLLDALTGRLAQLPGMPAFVSLKSTSIAWSDDGRLVLLGEDRSRKFVAVWRPGQPRLPVKTLQFPERRSGSDTFASLR